MKLTQNLLLLFFIASLSHAQQQQKLQLSDQEKAQLQSTAQEIESCSQAGVRNLKVKCHKGIVVPGPPKQLLRPEQCAQIYGVSLKLRCHDRVVKRLSSKLTFVWNHTYGKMIENTRRELVAAQQKLGLSSQAWLKEFDDGQSRAPRTPIAPGEETKDQNRTLESENRKWQERDKQKRQDPRR